MNFEVMKKIWDTQNNQTMYAIDESALFNIVKRKMNNANRSVSKTEIGLIIINFIVIVVFTFKEFAHGNSWYRLLTIGIALLISIYIFYRRTKRKGQEEIFDKSLLGELDFAISNISYHIYLAKTFFWYYILPFGFVVFLKLFNNFESKSIWEWLGQGVLFTFAYFLTNWEIKKCHLPKKRSLESLRNTLTQEA